MKVNTEDIGAYWKKKKKKSSRQKYCRWFGRHVSSRISTYEWNGTIFRNRVKHLLNLMSKHIEFLLFEIGPTSIHIAIFHKKWKQNYSNVWKNTKDLHLYRENPNIISICTFTFQFLLFYILSHNSCCHNKRIGKIYTQSK